MSNTMSRRQARIVAILSGGSASIDYISYELWAPQASVRRDIQGLRDRGYHISCNDGVYTMTVVLAPNHPESVELATA